MENHAQGGQSAQAAGASQTNDASPQSSQSQAATPQTSGSSLPDVSSVDPSVWNLLRGETPSQPQQAQEQTAEVSEAAEPAAETQEAQAAAPEKDAISDEQLTRAFALASGLGGFRGAQQAQQPVQQPAQQPVQQPQNTAQSLDAKAAAVTQKIAKAKEALKELDETEPVAIAVTAVIEGLEDTLQDIAAERERIRQTQENDAKRAQQAQLAAYQEQQRLTFAGLEQQGIKGFGKNGVPQNQQEAEAQAEVMAHAASIRHLFPAVPADALIARCAKFINETKNTKPLRMAPSGQPRTAARTHSAPQAPKQISSEAEALAFIRNSPAFRPQMPASSRA